MIFYYLDLFRNIYCLVAADSVRKEPCIPAEKQMELNLFNLSRFSDFTEPVSFLPWHDKFSKLHKRFQSCLSSLSWCDAFHMEINIFFTRNVWFIYFWIKLISIWKALHKDLLWNRGERQLGNHSLYLL